MMKNTISPIRRAIIDNIKASYNSLAEVKATLELETRMMARGNSDARYIEALQWAVSEMESEMPA